MPEQKVRAENRSSLQNQLPGLPDPEPRLGTILADARNRKKLTQMKVSEQLNLGQAIIDALENDRSPPEIPSTYIRGYQRAYIRLLGLDEVELLGQPGTVPSTIGHDGGLHGMGRPLPAYKESGGLVNMILKILTVLILVTAVFFLWPKFSTLLGLNPDQTGGTMENVAEAPGTGDAPDGTVAAGESAVAVDANSQTISKKIIIPAELDQSEYADNKPDEDLTVQVAPLATDQNPDVQPDSIPAVDIAQETAVLEKNDDADSAPEPSQSPAESLVTFVSNGEAWLSVSDANGKRLYQGTLRLDRKTFNAVMPLQVSTGNLPDLRIILDDGEQQKVDIFGENKAVAKFTITENTQGQLVFSPN